MKSKEVASFYRLQAPVYDFTRRFFMVRRQEAIAKLGVRPGETVIDFACGTGLNFPLLLKSKPSSLIGIDYSSDMLRQAKRKNLPVSLVRADLTQPVFRGLAEKAICTYGLSIMDEWEEILLKIKFCLQPSGRLVILDFAPLHGVLRPLNPIFRLWLKAFGVSADKPIGSFLERHFERVCIISPSHGYSAIYIADLPRGTS